MMDEFGETDGRYWLRMELADGIGAAEVGGQRSEDGQKLVTLTDLGCAILQAEDLVRAVLLRQ